MRETRGEETSMGNYRIITDSTADLTPELIQELDVQVIPLCYMMVEECITTFPAAER